MDADERQRLRRRSMIGTALFVLGIAAVITSVVIGSTWLAVTATVVVAVAIAMLARVGQSLG